MAADGPTAADWLSAWGQVGGAVATTAAVVVALWLAQRDRKWRRADLAAEAAEADTLRQERAFEQARLVSVAAEYTSLGGWKPEETAYMARPSHGPVYAQQVIHVVITNGSAGPIFGPRVHQVGTLGAEVAAVHTLHEKGRGPVIRGTVVVHSGETERIAVACEGADGDLLGPFIGAAPTVRFTDAAGQEWQRKGTSMPQKLIWRPPPGTWGTKPGSGG